QFLGVERSILVGIGRVEALLHNGEIFVERQRSIVIRIGRCEFLCGQPSAQLARIERSVMIRIELGEHRGRGLLHLGKIKRAVIVRVEHLDGVWGCRPGRTAEQRACNCECNGATRYHRKPPGSGSRRAHGIETGCLPGPWFEFYAARRAHAKLATTQGAIFVPRNSRHAPCMQCEMSSGLPGVTAVWRPTIRQRVCDFRIDAFCVPSECCDRSVKRRAHWEERMKRFAMAASLVMLASTGVNAQTT